MITICVSISAEQPSSESPKDNIAGCLNTRCSKFQHSTTPIQSAPRKSYQEKVYKDKTVFFSFLLHKVMINCKDGLDPIYYLFSLALIIHTTNKGNHILSLIEPTSAYKNNVNNKFYVLFHKAYLSKLIYILLYQFI